MKPEIGKRYAVSLTDCCVEATFTATLVADHSEDEYEWHLEWDNGVRTKSYDKDGMYKLVA